ncbi:MAG TPA: ABC transporter ATP-binding protein [Allosphingosinicella sp.]|nr:ABC transporter ATP-binding protein [Allosphingosinicella sp.]
MTTARFEARERWRWLGGHFKDRKRIAIFALAAGSATAAANIVLLLLLARAVDVAIPAGNISELLLVGVAMIAVKALSSAVTIWMTRLSSAEVVAAISAMQRAMAGRLHRLRWRDLHRLDTAIAGARLVHDAHMVAQMALRLATAAIPAVVPFLASVAILLLFDWRLAAVVIVLLPATRALHGLGAWRLRATTHRFLDRFDAYHRRTKHMLHLLPATRTHGVRERELSAHGGAADELAASHRSLVTDVAVSEQAGGLGTTILLAAILVGGGIAVASAAMSIGTLTAFLVAATQVQAALTAAAGAIPAVLSGDAALARICRLEDAGGLEPEGNGRPGPEPVRLTFDGVGARIGDRRILADMNFELRPGDAVAIVAANGEGKTTLLNIALGLIECDEGRVLIDGVDLAALDREAWRRSIGIVPQHPLFATATLAENVGFAAGDEKSAADPTGVIDALLATLPVGPEASVGENGALLSGGERQRIAIARALAGSPSLLVLDEPSNHLDADAVAQLIDLLFERRERPTILMATHDARLLRKVDRVLALEGGRLVPRSAPAGVAIAS